MVTFKNVTKNFTSKSVGLENVTISIKDGEFVFIVGPSGAGKTTFLRLITRDIIPTSGTVRIDKTDIAKLQTRQIPHLRRKVGTIFQDFKVLTNQTAFENVAIALEIRNKKNDEIKKSVTKTLTIVGLSKKINAFPIQLSAGELQRVSIARAIVGKPKILLADEPTGNLDSKIGWDIIKLLKNINKKGKTVIMATHDMDIVNSMKQRVIVLREGKVVSDKRNGKYI